MSELTGRHVLLITVGAFGVIIAVNVVMAWKAISTFPGLEVKNSYVASQGFDDRRQAQKQLGWTLSHDYTPSTGRLVLGMTDAAGQPAPVETMQILVGRTTEASEDQVPELVRVGSQWQANISLGYGKWLMKVQATSRDGTLFEQRIDFFVQG